MTTPIDDERMRRWRLLLGDVAEESTGGLASASDTAMDSALSALYDDRGSADGNPGAVPVSAAPHRAWRAGSATSVPTSPPRWCR